MLLFWPEMRPTRRPKAYDYFTKVFPCGVATGMDIGLGNSSLKVISLSFYTMVKSGAPVFVLLFAFLFRLEKPTWTLLSIILLIVSGVLLMILAEFTDGKSSSSPTEFNLTGYIEVQIATVLAGLRWSLTQILLERESMGMNNPLATNLFLAPLMGVSVFIACAVLEGLPFATTFFATVRSTIEILGLLAFGGVIAFIMVIFEYKLISATSVVTFSVAGIAKEIITILTSARMFGDKFTGGKIVGLVISIGGIAMYNYVRVRGVRSKLREGVEGRGKVSKGRDEDGNPLIGGDDETVEEEEEDDEDGFGEADGGIFGYHPVNSVAAGVKGHDRPRGRRSLELSDFVELEKDITDSND
ncbi:Triose-phosphate Transporter [Rhizophlyctis rosea]|uniref:Triose-phosphate Transporter n=1 Tax=Rhizophlyctis rosea TaxID=64517 RepID=A0AAD5S2H4_9FUNG|nr:Triose-phosphate Transporter [Rhizophlyctis rosea]